VIQERGKVLSVAGETVVIQPSGLQSCAKCRTGKGCGAGTLSTFFGRRQQSLTASSTISVAAGDNVVIEIHERALLLAAGLMYVLPVVLLLSGALFAKYIIPNASEFVQIVTALIGLSSGIFCSRRLSERYFKSHAIEPKVVARCTNS